VPRRGSKKYVNKYVTSGISTFDIRGQGRGAPAVHTEGRAPVLAEDVPTFEDFDRLESRWPGSWCSYCGEEHGDVGMFGCSCVTAPLVQRGHFSLTLMRARRDAARKRK
jgi:hypothetical protein